MIASAVRALPTWTVGHYRADAKPSLYIVSRDLSEPLQAALEKLLQEKEQAKLREEAEKKARDKIATDRRSAENLRTKIKGLESGEDLQEARRKLAEIEGRLAVNSR